jgi:hypothetical protein
MDRYFIAPPRFIGTSRLRLFPRLFFERFPIEHVPLRTALDDPARVGGQLRLDLLIYVFFLRLFGCEHPLDLFQDPPLVGLYRH